MKPTYVYVFGSDDCPRIKIGISDDPKRREVELINGCGFENARILWTSPPLHNKKEALYHEARIHQRLSEHRTCGEWFDADKVTVADVKQYFRFYPSPESPKASGAKSVAQFVGFDRNGREVYEGDTAVWHET